MRSTACTPVLAKGLNLISVTQISESTAASNSSLESICLCLQTLAVSFQPHRKAPHASGAPLAQWLPLPSDRVIPNCPGLLGFSGSAGTKDMKRKSPNTADQAPLACSSISAFCFLRVSLVASSQTVQVIIPSTTNASVL